MTAPTVAPEPAATPEHDVLHRLGVLDRYLPVWIGAAMALGLLLGRLVPGLNGALDAVRIGGVSLPIAVGLLAMMYPVLAKVRYDRIGEVTRDRRLLVPSLILNWVVGPALMFTLAWVFLPDLPEYRTGLIIVGLARCIAMVLIWNDLAGGDREAAAVLVAVNSVFQIVAYSLLGYFYLKVLPGWLGLHTAALHVSLWEIARMVVVFLGIPLAAGYLTRRVGVARKGEDWYTNRFLPRIGPIALWGLLFTVVVLFALQGDKITSQPLDVARIALPLLVYFAIMWGDELRPRRAPPPRLPPHRHAGVHRGGQQLRARHRGGHRRVRRHLRPGPRRGRRPPDRSPSPGRARLRRGLGPPPLLPQGGMAMNCYDCATQDHLARPAIGVCHDCGAAVCDAHAVRPGPSPDPHRHHPARGDGRARGPGAALHHLDAAYAALHRRRHHAAVRSASPREHHDVMTAPTGAAHDAGLRRPRRRWPTSTPVSIDSRRLGLGDGGTRAAETAVPPLDWAGWETRFVLFTGKGGVGKTTIASAVAGRSRRRGGGCCWSAPTRRPTSPTSSKPSPAKRPSRRRGRRGST